MTDKVWKGPGRVAAQSAYKHFHEPGWEMTASSFSTEKYW